MRVIKFREPLFNDNVFYKFHYWGCWDGYFIKPISSLPDKSQKYTGLFDKNGQPEYEGDRVKVTHNEYGWEYIGIIEYENGRFFVSCEGYAPDLVHPGHVYEVIGNVYEGETKKSKI